MGFCEAHRCRAALNDTGSEHPSTFSALGASTHPSICPSSPPVQVTLASSWAVELDQGFSHCVLRAPRCMEVLQMGC